MSEIRPVRTLTVGVLALLSACGSDASRPAPGPLNLASRDPFCGPVVERVLAYYSEQSTAQPVPADARFGGTVVVAGGGDLRGGLNGLTTGDQMTQETEARLVHGTLVRYDENGEVEPYFAESWAVDPDGTGIRFELRDELVFHDGEPLTAADVAFTLRRAMNPEVGFPNATWFALYDPAGIEIIDDHTIHLGFSPHAEVMDPWTSLSIMPEHLLGEVPPDELGAHPFGTQCPVGAGPYLFEGYRPGDQWVLRANPGFPDALGGRPFIDRYVYRIITDTPTRLAELLDGSIDVALELSRSQADAIEGRGNVDLRVLDQRSFAFIGWNTRLPGLGDVRVRRAITMALDRERLMRTLRGEYAILAETGVPEFHWAHDAGLEGPRFSPGAAQALLEAAGWTDRTGDGVRENGAGDELRFEVMTNASPEREAILQVLVEQMATVGIAIVPEVVEFGTLQARITNTDQRDFGGFILGWSHDFNINERDFFHSSAAETHPFGWSGIADPELDRLLDSLPLIGNRAAARPLWEAYQRRIIELQPNTYLYFSKRLNGVDADLADVVMDVRGELLSVPAWYWAAGAR